MSDTEHLSDEETDIFPPTLSVLTAQQTFEEYEHQIRTLQQMNATLRDNISALYAEANEMRMHATVVGNQKLVAKTHMELSEDEGYSATSIVPYIEHESSTEMQSRQKQIDKLTKTNARLRWKLGRQKLLVSQLSANLKVASDKIHELQCNEHNNNVGSTALIRLESQSSAHTSNASNTTIHYQIQSELDDLLHLITTNSARHKEYTTQLLKVDMAVHRNQVNEETVSDKIQRVIRQLRGDEDQEIFEAISSDANQSLEHNTDSTEKLLHSNLNHAESQSSLDRDVSGRNSISEKLLQCSNDSNRNAYAGGVVNADAPAGLIEDGLQSSELRHNISNSNECADGDVGDTAACCELQEHELHQHDLEQKFSNHDEYVEDNDYADVDSDLKENELQFTALAQTHNKFVDDIIDAIIDGDSTEDEVKSRCHVEEQKSSQYTEYADEIDAVVHGDTKENYLQPSGTLKRHCDLEENKSRCDDAGDQSDLKGDESQYLEQQHFSSIHANSSNLESIMSNHAADLDQEHPHSVSPSTDVSERDYSCSNYQEHQFSQLKLPETNKFNSPYSTQQHETENSSDKSSATSLHEPQLNKSYQTESGITKQDQLEIVTAADSSTYKDLDSEEINWSGHHNKTGCLPRNDGTHTDNELSCVDQPELTVTDTDIRMTEETNAVAQHGSPEEGSPRVFDYSISDLLPSKSSPSTTNDNMKLPNDTDGVEHDFSEKAAATVVFDYSISDLLPSKTCPPGGPNGEKIHHKPEQHDETILTTPKDDINTGVEYSISDLIPSQAPHHEVADDNEQLQLSSADVPTQNEKARDGKVRKKSLHGSSANSLSVHSLKAWKRNLSVNKSKAYQSAKSNDPLSVRLSRRELFQQRQGESLFESQERRQLRVLVRDENGVDFVPPPLPPSLPLTNQNSPLFKKGCPDGFYKYRSSSGNQYIGTWKGDKRHGLGTAKVCVYAASTLSFFPCASTYQSDTLNSTKMVRFTMDTGGKVSYRGFNSYFQSIKTQQIHAKNIYKGKRHGIGTLYLSNTEVFDGGWNNNKKNGIGLYFWIDGEVDVSVYINDVRVESIRWSKDRRSSFFLDLKRSEKSVIALSTATEIVRRWETNQQRASVSVAGSNC